MVGFLAEPVFMIVFFTVSFVAGSTIPYIVQQKWVTPLANFFAPSHVLLMLAFLMLILAEGGRIPVDNPTGHFELAMIDESKSLEYSGRGFALVKWGGQMKFFVLLCIFLNVLVTPWGLAREQTLGAVLLAIPLRALQGFLFSARAGGHRVVPLQAAAVSHRRIPGRGVHHFGGGHDCAGFFALSEPMSDATKQLLENLNALAAGLFLLTAFGIVAMRQARGCLNLFIAQSLLLAASAALLGLRYDSEHLYGVALVNLISKPIIVPWLLRKTSPAEIYTRREIDQVLNIPTALLIALALAIGAYFVGIPLANAVGPEFRGPNVPIGIAVLLLGAFTLTVRREALSAAHRSTGDGERRVPRRAFPSRVIFGMLVELAIATDGLVIVFIMGVLVRAVQQAGRHDCRRRIGESQGDGGGAGDGRGGCCERHRHSAAAARSPPCWFAFHWAGAGYRA